MATQVQPTSMTENPASSLTSELRALFNDRLITPDDSKYEEARAVSAGGIDRRPAAIVRVANTSDVSQLVSLARERGIELASAVDVTASQGTVLPKAASCLISQA